MKKEQIGELSNFIVIRSLKKSKKKVIVYKNPQNFYLFSQNCICFNIFGTNYIVSPLSDISTCLMENQKNLRPGLNKIEDLNLEDSSTYSFYLNYGQSIKLKYIYKDPKLIDLYINMMKDQLMPNIKGLQIDVNFDLLASFAIFEPAEENSLIKFVNIDKWLEKDLRLKKRGKDAIEIFDEVEIVSNSYVLSFESLFRGVKQKCAVSQRSVFYEGVYRLDLRGFPEVEGSLVINKNRPFGVILPGLFYNGNFREYLCFCMDLNILIKNMFSSLHTFPDVQPSISTRIWDYIQKLRGKKRQDLITFWLERTCKVYIFDQEDFQNNSGTGLAINRNLVITNAHLATKNPKFYGYVTLKDKKTEIAEIIKIPGSLDLCFLVLKQNLEKLPRLNDEWSFKDVFCSDLKRNSASMSYGYPIDGTFSDEANVSISKGEVLSFWHYENQRRKISPSLKKLLNSEPVFVLVSNMIFNGNSGGPILDGSGRLIGIVFCTMKVDQRTVINEMALGVNINLIGKMIWRLITKPKTKKEYERIFLKQEILSLRDKLLDDASQFYMPLDFIQKL